MSVSLKQRLSLIGEPRYRPLWLRGSFGRRTPHSLRVAIGGMTDPDVFDWQEVGIALAEKRTDLSDNSQGATTDGTHWFVCSDNAKEVVAFDDAANHVAIFKPGPIIRMQMWYDVGQPNADTDANGLPQFGSGDFKPHFGAPSFNNGWIYVPIQNPLGIWRFSINGAEQFWHIASYNDHPAPADDDLFPWCAIHPVTGVLYTCNFGTPHLLPHHFRAYDPESLEYRPSDDILIGQENPLRLDHVQGGVFTSHARLILVCSDPNAVFCFSSMNGYCFGAKTLGDFGHNVVGAGSELEGVTVRSWQFDGSPAYVHIFELENEPFTQDNFYLHGFWVPTPQLL